jgi:uncharacterized membrane protein AbrB (regulator of aidB expression)
VERLSSVAANVPDPASEALVDAVQRSRLIFLFFLLSAIYRIL